MEAEGRNEFKCLVRKLNSKLISLTPSEHIASVHRTPEITVILGRISQHLYCCIILAPMIATLVLATEEVRLLEERIARRAAKFGRISVLLITVNIMSLAHSEGLFLSSSDYTAFYITQLNAPARLLMLYGHLNYPKSLFQIQLFRAYGSITKIRVPAAF